MSTSRSVSSAASVSGSKTLVFRVLTLAAAGLMLLSWFMPWWRATIDALHDAAVVIRPWGLEHSLGPDMAKMIDKAAMPAFFAPFMWTFLGVCMLALLLSLVAPDKAIGFGRLKLALPQILVAGVGVAYVVAVIVCFVYGSMRTTDFWNLKFIGYTYINLGEPAVTGVTADLQPGYYLSWVVGILLIALGLLRNKIIGFKQT